MAKVFWTIAALDALALAALIVAALAERGHNDGGREMGLIFYGFVPLLILAGVVAVFVLVPHTVVRWICLVAVAGPMAFYAFVVVGERTIGRLINAPENAHANPAMRELVRAVDRLDVEGVRRWAPQMDRSLNQELVTSPLRIAIDKMVEEQKTRLPAQTGRHLAILKILLENGAHPNEALQVACWTRSGELLASMFKAGADPNFVNQYGSASFFSCLDRGIGVPGSVVPMVAEFVKAGVDVNRKSNLGFLPAIYALECDQFDAALYLAEHGADPDLEDEQGRTLRGSVAERLGDAAPEELKRLAGWLAR